MAGEDLEHVWSDHHREKDFIVDLPGTCFRSGMQCPATGCFHCGCTGCYYADFIRDYWNCPHCD